MVKLHDCHAPGHLDVARQAGEPGDVRIIMNPQLAGKSDTNRLHGRGTRHRETKSAESPHGEPTVLFVGESPVGVALLVGQWRKHQTIRHRGTMWKSHRLEDTGV
jgi:hypothetical protein